AAGAVPSELISPRPSLGRLRTINKKVRIRQYWYYRFLENRLCNRGIASVLVVSNAVWMREQIEAIPGGRHGLSRSEVNANRRERLTAAMVEAVALYGYPGTTISRLVAIARISKTDFYGVFSSKEECFWAAFEECLESFAQNVEGRV